MKQEIRWEKLNQIILDCGSIREVTKFCTTTINLVQEIIPFDQGRVYFINDNNEVYDEYLLGVDKVVTQAYHEYYSRIEDGHYSATKRMSRMRNKKIYAIDWNNQPVSDRFIKEHLKPQGIHYSTGFMLTDLQDSPKALFCLDRTGYVNYSETDMRTLRYIDSHLNNLHKNLYVVPPGRDSNFFSNMHIDEDLTRREKEIVELMMDGVLPSSISDKLHISISTVYKHINHIHRKLNVSNRQELIVKLNRKY